ncbi:MAG: RapZ C-terminal domain-containing protein, partial [Kaistella sp.]
MSLTIEIHSFSYKKGGIPKDETGNGGGFAFDCRGILNPGRIEEYKAQTGCDIGVQEFLENKTDMPKFLELVKNIVSINID